MKPVIWIGSSLKDLRGFPEEVQSEIGHSLRDIQKCKDPGNIKLLRHLGVSGISEIIIDERQGTFRAVYTVEFKMILILHRLKQAKDDCQELRRKQ